MAQPRHATPAGRPRPVGQRWMLGPGAPDWFRRIWDERNRTIPRTPKLDLNRIRRIAYL